VVGSNLLAQLLLVFIEDASNFIFDLPLNPVDALLLDSGWGRAVASGTLSKIQPTIA
jgi:hypothetical protein